MFAAAILPAILVVIGRFFVCDSAHWLVSRGRMAEAATETHKLLRREPQYPKLVELIDPHHHEGEGKADRAGAWSFGAIRQCTASTRNLPRFTPLVSPRSFDIRHRNFHARNSRGDPSEARGTAQSVSGLVTRVQVSAKGTALLDVLLVVGVLVAILLVERAGRIRLQIIGFIGCAVGLGLAALSQDMTGTAQMTLLFAGFMLFNFMTNMGPNAQTYLLAGEVFPTHIRGYGAGFAASFAKIGAVATAFLFPFLLKDIGTQMLLVLLIISSLAGAVVTWIFRIETRGTLEDVSRVQPQV